jgi:hypothetical protein
MFDDNPLVTHVPYNRVVLIQHVNIWHHLSDYEEENFWPNTTNTLCSLSSWKAQRLNKYIRSISPEWGRKAEVHDDDNSWGRIVNDDVGSSDVMESPMKMARYQ